MTALHPEKAVHLNSQEWNRFWTPRIIDMIRHAVGTYSNTVHESKIEDLSIPRDWPLTGEVTFIRSRDKTKIKLVGSGKEFKIIYNA
tara:strand:- start:330 stop:590 length:261 start_codon:yes stop_codon:yes gene_type:complete